VNSNVFRGESPPLGICALTDLLLTFQPAIPSQSLWPSSAALRVALPELSAALES